MLELAAKFAPYRYASPNSQCFVGLQPVLLIVDLQESFYVVHVAD